MTGKDDFALLKSSSRENDYTLQECNEAIVRRVVFLTRQTVALNNYQIKI